MRIPTFTQFQHQAEMISKQYDNLSTLQTEASTGKKLINASDDPVLAAQVNSIQDYINKLTTYDHNGKLTTTRYSLFNTTIQNSINAVSDVQSLILQAKNGTLKDSDRASLANQMQGDFNTLLNLANTQDSEGTYIYSGYNTNVPPFSNTGSGIQYNGGNIPSTIDIGDNQTAIFNESGYNIFSGINNGNGTYTVTANPANTGTASTSAGAASASYVADTYTISFVTNSAGQLAYQVVGANSGQIIPQPPATTPANAPAYIPGTNGTDISFNGITININGSANAGDSFQIQPSTKQDIFTMIQNTLALLKNPVANQGKFSQSLSQTSSALSQAFNHLVSYQSDFGSRTATINNTIAANSKILTDQTIVKGKLEDADLSQVFSKLSQQSLALQVTQQSYLKIQETLSALLKL